MRKNCSSVRKKNEKNFWDMEIIGNRRKSDVFFTFLSVGLENYVGNKHPFSVTSLHSIYLPCQTEYKLEDYWLLRLHT